MNFRICRGEGEGHGFPLNSAIYTCGSCSITFTTICTLHDHILEYELGGSFCYDGFTKTAFPKHRAAIAETQTGWKDKQEAQYIFANKSESNIYTDLRLEEYSDNDNNESDRECGGDFLDEHENIINPEKNSYLEEEHHDIMKQSNNEFKSKTTEAGSLYMYNKTEKSVIEDQGIKKTESVIEHEKQKIKHTLDNAYVKLKRLELTHIDSEILKQKETDTSQLELAKIRKQEKRVKSVTLSSKTGKRKTQHLFDPLSRKSKIDVEDTFFKRCAAQQTRLDAKKKETIETEETKVAEKRTATRNKPRKSYHYSSEENESDELNEEVLAKAVLLSHRHVYPPPEEEEGPIVLPKKKEKYESIRCNTSDLKPKGKQQRVPHNAGLDVNEDNNADDKLEKIADGDNNQADTMYTCNLCQETIELSMKIKHMAKHKIQKKVICYVCGIVVPHRRLDDHIRTKHGTGETPLTCEICGKGWQTKKQLYEHRRSAHTVGKHKCKYCERTFLTSFQEREHIKRIHTGERNHLCPHCGMAFFSMYGCTKHVKIVHLKIKPYECDKCPQRFSQKSNYQKHMETHAETRKTFECMYCNRKLSEPKSLRRHLQIHTGENKNSCHLCDYSTIQRQCLAKHWATCHGLPQEQIQDLLTEIKNKNKRRYINDM